MMPVDPPPPPYIPAGGSESDQFRNPQCKPCTNEFCEHDHAPVEPDPTVGEREKRARWGICDMDCQPDWHNDDCAIYLPKPTTPAEPVAEVSDPWPEWATHDDDGVPMRDPAEPDAGDVESLAKVLHARHVGFSYVLTCYDCRQTARAVLSSDWLDAVRQKAGDDRAEQIAQALRKIAREPR